MAYENYLGGFTGELVLLALVVVGVYAELKYKSVSSTIVLPRARTSHESNMGRITQAPRKELDLNTVLGQALLADKLDANAEMERRTGQQRNFITQKAVSSQMQDVAEILKANRPKGGDGRG